MAFYFSACQVPGEPPAMLWLMQLPGQVVTVKAPSCFRSQKPMAIGCLVLSRVRLPLIRGVHWTLGIPAIASEPLYFSVCNDRSLLYFVGWGWEWPARKPTLPHGDGLQYSAHCDACEAQETIEHLLYKKNNKWKAKAQNLFELTRNFGVVDAALYVTFILLCWFLPQ